MNNHRYSRLADLRLGTVHNPPVNRGAPVVFLALSFCLGKIRYLQKTIVRYLTNQLYLMIWNTRSKDLNL